MNLYDGNKIQWDAIDCFCRNIQLIKTNKWDERVPFVFDGTVFDIDSGEEIILLILKYLLEFGCPKKLAFQNTVFDLKSQLALHELLHQNTSITLLTLRNLKSENRCLLTIPGSIFHHDSNLLSLTFERCSLDEVGAYELGQWLHSPRCTLQRIFFQQLNLCCANGWSVLTEGIAHNVSLHSISVTDCISMQLSETLQLLRGIARSQSIRWLALENLKLDSHHAPFICECAMHIPGLEYLSLRRNSFTSGDIAVILSAMDGSSIKSLYLAGNPIGNKFVESMILHLRSKSCTLQYLCLIDCEIWREGCHLLAQGLAVFHSLKGLYLDGNEIEQCGSELLNSLHQNTTIQEIVRSESSLWDYLPNADYDCWLTIFFYLRANRSNRKELLLCLDSNSGDSDILYSSIPILLARECYRHNTDVIYYFVRSMQQHCNSF
jgi:Ran GTPase-activating protein (RanGAP) involved in mRNA processing and transport